MKKLSFVFILLFFFQVNNIAQPCLPQGITFTTQEEIDNFQSNYPNCTEIQGTVVIGDGPPNPVSNIQNLNGLSAITHIGGNLIMGGAWFLTSLEGMDNLMTIGGSLKIGYLYNGGGLGNGTLPNLTGLESLNSIGEDLWIRFNLDLIELTGLNNLNTVGGDLVISQNKKLESLTGLNLLTSVGGELYIAINDSLISLGGLEGLTTLGGNFRIGSNYALTSLTEMDNLTTIPGYFTIIFNNNLINLAGLGNVTSIGNTVEIHTNNSLTSLAGLEGLNSIVSKLQIANNNALTSLAGLNNLTTIEEGGYITTRMIQIGSNPLLTSLTGIENIEPETIDNLQITGNTSLTTCDVKGICDYLSSNGGFVSIHDNATGCNSRTEVEDACDEAAVNEIRFVDKILISPNPFVNEVKVEFELSEPAIIEIIICNHLGVEVDNIVEPKYQGHQEINWNSENLPSGIYFCLLKTNEGIQTKKMIKLN